MVAMGLGLALALCRPAAAAEPPVCAGGQSIGQFRFLVQPAPKVRARPLAAVNRLEKGRKLLYIPIRLKSDRQRQATIALVLIPAGNSPEQEWVVLDPRPAAAATQWEVPFDVGVVAAVYGPRGLNIKKVRALVKKNQDVITQLADYAQQTAQVGALVEALAAWERSPADAQPLDAVLQGFSAQHNISLPRIDPKAPADQQAALLLRTLLPSLTTYDPLNPRPAQGIRQSAGLAASLATLFLGNSALLATGGVALFQNLRTLISPGTDFRSAFAQNVSPARRPALFPAAARQGPGQDRLPVGPAHPLPGGAPGESGFRRPPSHRPESPAADLRRGCLRLEAVAASPRLEAGSGCRRAALPRRGFAPGVAACP